MEILKKVKKVPNSAVFLVFLVFLLYYTYVYNLVFFHTLAVFFSVIIAITVFILSQNSRQFIKNDFFHFLGVVYLFVGFFDFMHAISFEQLGIFKTNGVYLQLWHVARLAEALSLLVAPVFLYKNIRIKFTFIAYLFLSSTMTFMIFFMHWSRLNPLAAVLYRYYLQLHLFTIFFLLSAGAFLYIRRIFFERKTFYLLISSVACSVFSEISFLFFLPEDHVYNLIGHYLKLTAVFLIYKAIISDTLEKTLISLTANLKTSQDLLQKEKAKAVKYLDVSGNITVILNKERCINFVNDKACRFLGVERNNLLGQNFLLNFVTGDFRKKTDSLLAETFKNLNSCYHEIPITCRGRIHLINWHISLDQEEKDSVILSGTDITEIKETEQTLKKECQNLLNIMDSMDDGICIINENYGMEYVNPVLMKNFGPYDSLKCFEYFNHDKKICPNCPLGAVLSGSRVRWQSDSCKNGKTYDIMGTPLKNSDGSVFQIEIFRDITELKEAEEKLIRSEKQYKAIVEDQTELICRTTPDGTLIFVNEACCRHFNKKREELIGAKFWPSIPKEDHKKIKYHIEKLTSQNPIGSIEHRVIGKNRMLHQHWIYRGFFNGNDNLIEIQTVGRDITELKEAEEKLIRSEKQYKAIVEDQTELICRTTPDGTLIFVNGAFCRHYNIRRDQLVGIKYWPSIPKEEHKKIIDHINSLTPSNPIGTIDHLVLYKGKLRWQHWVDRGFFDSKGKLIEIQSVGRDVTELKQIEDSLQQEKKLLSGIMSSISIGIILINESKEIVFCNNRSRELLGIKPEEQLKQNILEVLKIRNQNFKNFFASGKKNKDFVYKFRKINGSDAFLSVNFTPVLSREGRIIKTVVCVEDVTEQKRADEEIKNSEKKHREIVQDQTELICRFKTEGTLTFVNNAYCNFFKKRRSDLIGNKSDFHIIGRQRQTFKSCFSGLSKDNPVARNEQQFIDNDGKRYWLQWTDRLLYDETRNKIIGFQSVGRDVTKEKLIEIVLKDSEEKFRLAVNNYPAIFVIYGKDRRVRFINENGLKILKRSKKQILGHTDEEVLPAEISSIIVPSLKKCIMTGQIQHEEFRVNYNDKKLIFVVNYIPVLNSDKSLKQILGITFDITERKKTEEEMENLITQIKLQNDGIEDLAGRLKKEKDTLSVIMENTAAQLAYLDLRFNFIRINSAFAKACNVKKDELIGKNYFDLFPGRENREIFEKVRDLGKSVEFKAKPFNLKNQLWQQLSYWDWTLIPVKDNTGRVEGLVLSLMDVTEMVENQKNLKDYARELEQLTWELNKFRLAVESTSEQLIIADKNFQILYANKATETITGFLRKEITGRTPLLWGNYFEEYGNKTLRSVWHKISEENPEFHGEVININKNGKKYFSDLIISPVYDEKKHIRFFIAIERDITKLKEIDQAKTEFVSLASHQLRTPLTGISLSAELLLKEAENYRDKKQKKYFDEILRSTAKMSETISTLLNVTKIEMGTFEIKPSKADVIKIVDNIVSQLSWQIKNKKICLAKKYPVQFESINVDVNSFKIIVENILTNAIRYTSEKGKICIQIQKIRDSAVISIADSGCGIPQIEQKDIFSKLFRASNAKTVCTDGIGLGLYMVKSIAEKNKIKINFESIQDRGTTFFIHIPL
ncbi:PAS domain S-box protein [Candidatus Parcubacteria bacterium]|nr:MAG: PAS domain S-box protein [Candidatus Parcubacteria bacterium]